MAETNSEIARRIESVVTNGLGYDSRKNFYGLLDDSSVDILHSTKEGLNAHLALMEGDTKGILEVLAGTIGRMRGAEELNKVYQASFAKVESLFSYLLGQRPKPRDSKERLLDLFEIGRPNTELIEPLLNPMHPLYYSPLLSQRPKIDDLPIDDLKEKPPIHLIEIEEFNKEFIEPLKPLNLIKGNFYRDLDFINDNFDIGPFKKYKD